MIRHTSKSESRPALLAGKHTFALCAFLATTTCLAVDIRISDLRDINFGSVSPTAGQLLNTMNFCVSMSENGRYSIVASGTGTADAFVLSNGVWDLPYTLRFSDKPGRRGVLLTPGLPQTGFKAKKRKNRSDCNQPTASIEVTIESAELQAAGAGRYSGVLVLTVSPE